MYANEDESDTESTSKTTATPTKTPAGQERATEPASKPAPKARQTAAGSSAGAKEGAAAQSQPQPTVQTKAEPAGTIRAQRPVQQSAEPKAALLTVPSEQPQVRVVPSSPGRQQIAASPRPLQQNVPLSPSLRASTEFRRPSRDKDHLSIVCHLFPRLSETNLNFHDIYWGIDPKTRKTFLRKRMVNVSKVFSFHSLQPTQRTQQLDPTIRFKLKLFLVDTRPRASQQIVSNVHDVHLEIQQTRFGRFCQRTPSKSILVRSNYKQAEVVLRLELFQGINSCGISDVALLDANQASRLPTRTQTLTIGDFRFSFDVADPKLVPQADCLPDILICSEDWIPMLAVFRQLTADVLAERENTQQTTWIADPIVAAFPNVCEHPRLIEMFLALLNKKPRYDTATFRKVFMRYIYPLVHTIHVPNEKVAIECRQEIERNGEDPLKLLAQEKNAPFNVFQYTVHLSGYHALD